MPTEDDRQELHSAKNRDRVVQIRDEIESYLASLSHPLMIEEGAEPVDLTTSEWKLTCQFGKLILEVWNSSRSLNRRIERVIRRDHRSLGVLARRPGAAQPDLLEFRSSDRTEFGNTEPASHVRDQYDHAETRDLFRREFLEMLKREFPAWSFQRVSNRSDREHSLSSWYTRGLALCGRTAWAFLGLSEFESPAASDGVLASGLIWMDCVHQQPVSAGHRSVTGLKLFLPRASVEVTAHRAAYLDPARVKVELLEWNPGRERPLPVDLSDYGNVETRVSPRRDGEALIERHQALLGRLLAPSDSALETFTLPAWQSTSLAGSELHRTRLDRITTDYGLRNASTSPHAHTGRMPTPQSPARFVDVVPETEKHSLSLRVCGLEVARIEGGAPPRVHFGLEGEWQTVHGESTEEFHSFLTRVMRIRNARSEDPSSELYRVQGERWLESLLVRDITKIDPALLPDFVYPQVPAFAGAAASPEAYNDLPDPDALFSSPGMTRGVIDVLCAARTAPSAACRLAVVELKVHEEINLPLQGLDYWLRVKWLQDRGQFKEFGYFSGIELYSAPPLLYLVSPAFRFHSTTDRLIRYLSPGVEVILVGINDQWRKGIRVLFRRQARTEGPN